MRRLTVPLLMSALLLAGCGGRFSDSGWNPLRWMDRGQRAPQTLAPDGGYGLAGDERPSVPQLLGVRWEPLNEGRLLVVTGIGPTKGYFDAELITAVAQPEGRISPDPDGVLRLRFVALPPPPDAPAARLPANPAVDTITVALPLSHTQLAAVQRVEISSASNMLGIAR
ncbi:hypothetical protein SAMN04489859_102197 [Paracoccus alcaliphilus]|uniref:Lipoprotein n=1 Tax=Paracoccus alcaliphilus TaxID=34002 RepID=A0A1H8KDW8_9RHOB|nr:hypothetical protein [Paracoccus alcaliphilus]WCR17121.1 hypothetical protein JHW40_12060 [Paracoccus alcaliphilus]SEN91173.1 hypothetical protein SAMN04489859_102197 [Paracoccus alcaliphilus]